MGIFFWAVFGLFAGVVARLTMPHDESDHFIVTIIVGIVGAVAGGLISTELGFGVLTRFSPSSFLVAIMSSSVLLIIYRFAAKSSLTLTSSQGPNR